MRFPSLDFFNLLWAGIAMLIAFIAFLVCFELPRGEALFAVDEAAKLALDDDVISGLVTGSRHPVRRCPWPEICRRGCPIKPLSFILMRLDGSKRKFQAVQKLPSDCDFDRRLRSISNS